ncbi:MAG: prolyl oligopeptidase family serine peptidase [Chthoniobacteraceae bacterium]
MHYLPVLLALCSIACAETPAVSQWNGFEKLDFTVVGRPALLVKPATAAAGKPWIWRTEFFGHEPQGDIALLKAGWHVAYFKVSDMYGAPQSIELMAQFHGHVTREFGLSQRAVLEGFSRGGLYAVNFAAAHPAKTAALYLDAPVLDIRSWPGGKGKGTGNAACWKQALEIYGLTEETAKDFKGNPLDKAAVLAKSGIPVISVVGDADDAVPYLENTKPFADKYRAAGGTIEVIVKPGVNHHPHSLKDPKPIVDFLLQHVK